LKTRGSWIRDEVVMIVYGMHARATFLSMFPLLADPAKAVRPTEFHFSTTQYSPTQPHVR
jgi:hypothetical protein